MNIYTHEIAKLLKISLEEALKVQHQMECNGFDFSESTKAQFKREAKYSAQEIGLTV